jgi:hypothetical protein
MKTSLPLPLPLTLIEAVKYFAEPGVAHQMFAGVRWPDGVVTCPRCGSDSVNFFADKCKYQCRKMHPSRGFTVKVGTVMEDSPIKLEKWAVAFWLEVNAKNSISSYEMHRALGITQKSAWFLQQRVRLAVQSGITTKMSGGVEVDESFIGGKARNMHAAKRARVITGTGGAGKTAVTGLLERHGPNGHSKVRTKVVGDTRRKTLQPIVREHVEAGAKVFSDALASYAGLEADYVHQVVDHAECYVRGEVHTNGLENFWALFKRCIKGTHVSVEPFHLFRYLDAECFRFNNRKENDLGRFLLAVIGISDKRLTYKELTGKLLPEGVPSSDKVAASGNGGMVN